MVDIDKFKVLNDTYGHATGDEVLRAVAGAIVAGVREDDVPARFGGEEFVVLLRNPTAGGRASRSASASGRPSRALDLSRARRAGVSVSVGVAVARPRGPADRRASSRPRTRPCTGPSARAATGSSPPSRRAYHARRAGLPADERPTDRPLTNGDLARIFHEIGDMLEVKGELVFKTVAYHRAADAIGRSPVDLVARLPDRDAAEDPRRRQGDQRQDRRAGHDRPDGLPTTGSAPRSRPASSSCSRSRASARRPSASSTRSSASRSIEDLRQAAEAGRLRDAARACRRRPRRSSSRGSSGSRRTPDRMLLDQAEERLDAS